MNILLWVLECHGKVLKMSMSYISCDSPCFSAAQYHPVLFPPAFYECKKMGERKLISNKRLTEWLLFCLGHVVWHTCQVLCGANNPPSPLSCQASCSVARCTMKGPGWPIKGPIEIQPRAGQRATVWTVEIWHPLTEAPYSPLRTTLTGLLAGDQELSHSLVLTHYLLTPG